MPPDENQLFLYLLHKSSVTDAKTVCRSIIDAVVFVTVRLNS